MRENISTIFAVLFGVVVLIIFPLFSVMSRQDSISYNRVLTLTTEFVDGVRSTGYLTEKDYTNYLVNLAKTNNSYNVQLEYHEKILIKDINNMSPTNDEQSYVEDTLIYYNKDINEMLLENNGKIKLNENDEFYVKIYNTNITTASLLYNYFARVSVASKIINIGYGGKVSHITGVEYTKTDFSNSYSPYIKLGEIVDSNGNNNKTCFDSNAGTYDIQTCVRMFEIEQDSSLTIRLPFEMYNFENIIHSENANREIISVSEFEANTSNITSAIKNLITLRGIEHEQQEKKYIVNIIDMKYENGVIKGQIEISNIYLPDGLTIKPTNVVIAQGLGMGPTGIISLEAKSHEIILTEIRTYPQFELLGPFESQEISATTTNSFEANSTSYFKVKLTDYESELEVQLRDLETGEVVPGSLYNISYVEEVANKEYWIKLNYYSLLDKNFVLEVTTDKPVEGQEDKSITEKATVQSDAFMYESVDYAKLEQWLYVLSPDTVDGITTFTGMIHARFDKDYENGFPGGSATGALFNHSRFDTMEFMAKIVNNLNLKIAYSGENQGYPLNYTIETQEYELNGIAGIYTKPGAGYGVNSLIVEDTENGYYLRLGFQITMKLSSTTEQFIKNGIMVGLVFNDMAGNEKINNNYGRNFAISLLGLKIPQGFTYKQEGTNIYITDNTSGLNFKWISRNKISNDPYLTEDDKAFYNAMKTSIEKNNGYYLATKPIDITYTDTDKYPVDTEENFRENNKYYWQQAWNESCAMYSNNPDIVSHIPYWLQITEEIREEYKGTESNLWLADFIENSFSAYTHQYLQFTSIDITKFKYGLALYLK